MRPRSLEGVWAVPSWELHPPNKNEGVNGGWGLEERRVEGVKTGKMSGDESEPEAKPGENKKRS